MENKDNNKDTKEIELSFDNKSNLENLKECYVNLQKDFDLPSFDDLNRNFQIEKIQGEDTDYLIREVRKYVAEKITNYLRFLETLMQPANAQMFVYMMIKPLDAKDSKKMQELYKKMARLELDLIGLDLKFDSDLEAKFINDANDLWKDVSCEILLLMDKIKTNWDSEKGEDSRKNYFC